jgi:hypothetical protein
LKENKNTASNSRLARLGFWAGFKVRLVFGILYLTEILILIKAQPRQAAVRCATFNQKTNEIQPNYFNFHHF